MVPRPASSQARTPLAAPMPPTSSAVSPTRRHEQAGPIDEARHARRRVRESRMRQPWSGKAARRSAATGHGIAPGRQRHPHRVLDDRTRRDQAGRGESARGDDGARRQGRGAGHAVRLHRQDAPDGRASRCRAERSSPCFSPSRSSTTRCATSPKRPPRDPNASDTGWDGLERQARPPAARRDRPPSARSTAARPRAPRASSASNTISERRPPLAASQRAPSRARPGRRSRSPDPPRGAAARRGQAAIDRLAERADAAMTPTPSARQASTILSPRTPPRSSRPARRRARITRRTRRDAGGDP